MGSLSIGKPIFIVGPPRSGTTLMARILNEHQEIHSPGETFFFEDIWSRRGRFGTLESRKEMAEAVRETLSIYGRYNWTKEQAFVDQHLAPNDLTQSALDLGGGYRGLFIAYMQAMSSVKDKPHYCDDTPKHLFHLPDILTLLPEAKFIFCVRDPRDFLCSYKNYWRRSQDTARVKAIYHPIITSLLWNSSAKLISRYQQEYPDKTLLLKYEELVADPEAVIQQVTTFIQLPYQTQMLQISTSNSSFGENREGGIFKSSVGRWTTCLKPEEVWLMQKINGDLLPLLNYHPEPVSPNWLRVASYLIGFPFALLRALYANRDRRGSLSPYIIKRARALFNQ
jgi:hypothetical protein